MITYIIFCIIDILFNIVCYLTNPIVVLFADECGELPRSLRWWQTWDNPLDISWMVTEHHVPHFAEYDFCKHYIYYPENHSLNVAGYVDLIDPHFTLWERVQRYVCRLAWVYRNTGYGFSYEVTGVDVCGADIDKVHNEKHDEYRFQYYKADNAFMLRYENPWNKKYKWRIFLGWKIQDVEPTETKRCMLALYANPFWKR